MIRTDMLGDDPDFSARTARTRAPRPGPELYPLPRWARIRGGRRGYPIGIGAICGVFVLGSVAHVSPALAEDHPGESGSRSPAAAASTHAQAHFELGREHYRARRYREAIREFELALAEQPSAEVWFDLGRCHEQLGEYALAIDGYRNYLRDRVDAPDADEVRKRIELIEKQQHSVRNSRLSRTSVSALAIDASEPGVIVLLDGEPIGTGPFDRIVSVTPGRHRIDASRKGFAPFRAQVDVQPGALSAAYVEPRPLTDPRNVARRGSKVPALTWISGGVAVAGLAGSLTLGAMAIARRDDGDDRSARRFARASDITLGAALCLALTATVAYFAESRP